MTLLQTMPLTAEDRQVVEAVYRYLSASDWRLVAYWHLLRHSRVKQGVRFRLTLFFKMLWLRNYADVDPSQ